MCFAQCDYSYIPLYRSVILRRLHLQVIIFNKIVIPNNKFQMASGQGSHWLIERPTILSSMYSPPLSDVCQFNLNIFTLLALTQSFWQFVPFIYHPLWERVLSHVQSTLFLNKCCFVSSGSTAFFKFEEHILINILITVHYFKHFYLVSS